MNGTPTNIDIASSTPPPLNGVVNGNGSANDSASAGTLKFTTGLILPPPDVKCTVSIIPAFPHKTDPTTYMRIYTSTATVDRTIVHMNRSSDPLQFEVKLRESRRTDPAFSFLNPADPYHAYYRNRLEAAMRGEVLEGLPADSDNKAGPTSEEKLNEDYGKPPPPTEFLLEMPNISAVDLYVLDF